MASTTERETFVYIAKLVDQAELYYGNCEPKSIPNCRFPDDNNASNLPSNCKRVLMKMEVKDEVSWNTIMLGLGQHGHVEEMIGLFEKMKETGLKADHHTVWK